MRFFFPDSMDLVDPTFDFESETRNANRVRHRDDLYVHEVFEDPPCDGILVSKAIVDGTAAGSGKYSISQRQRFLRQGVRRFFRLNGREAVANLKTMGDCGAFTYVKEEVPPYSVEEVIGFYEMAGFDFGVSIDHVILGYDQSLDAPSLCDNVPADWRRRQDITISFAKEFLEACRDRGVSFEPVGIVQGWSPDSYAHCFNAIQQMGYKRIALGGLVPLKTPEILTILKAIDGVRLKGIDIHLFGVTRTEELSSFSGFGVTSFDSASPLRRSFMDNKDNYYSPNGPYTAVRIPMAEASPGLKRLIKAGTVDHDEIRRLEKSAMTQILQYGRHEIPIEQCLDVLLEFSALHSPGRDYSKAYRRTLSERPWEQCPCAICRKIGIHVILFRGAERNRRRGFHNLYVFSQDLDDRRAKLKSRPKKGSATCQLPSKRKGKRSGRANGPSKRLRAS